MEEDIVTTPESESSSSISLAGAGGVHEFVRYFVASGIALLADIGMLKSLTDVLHIPYLISGAIAFVVGLVIIYALSTKWVFMHRKMRNPGLEFGLFVLIGIVGLGLNELALWILTTGFGLYYLYSKIVSIGIVFTWNFVARKILLF